MVDLWPTCLRLGSVAVRPQRTRSPMVRVSKASSTVYPRNSILRCSHSFTHADEDCISPCVDRPKSVNFPKSVMFSRLAFDIGGSAFHHYLFYPVLFLFN